MADQRSLARLGGGVQRTDVLADQKKLRHVLHGFTSRGGDLIEAGRGSVMGRQFALGTQAIRDVGGHNLARRLAVKRDGARGDLDINRRLVFAQMAMLQTTQARTVAQR